MAPFDKDNYILIKIMSQFALNKTVICCAEEKTRRQRLPLSMAIICGRNRDFCFPRTEL